MGKKDGNLAEKCSNYIQVSTKNTSLLGKRLIADNYPITGSYYYLSWSGASPPDLSRWNSKWAVWSPSKDEAQVEITSDGFLKISKINLYLSWSSMIANGVNLSPRKWAIWRPSLDTQVEITSDGYLKIKSKNLYLSWSGYRKNILGDYRLSAVWSPSKDTPINNVCKDD